MPPIVVANKNPAAMNSSKPKKIIFDDDGEVVAKIETDTNGFKSSVDVKVEPEDEDFFSKRERKNLEMRKQMQSEQDETQMKWYNVYPQYSKPIDPNDLVELKEKNQTELFNICKGAFEAEKPAYIKRNPSDFRWLQSALHKGTARDRANAGALLVTSNPLGNLDALSTLVGFTRLSNKASSEVIGVLTELWREVLLPPHRKLVSLQMRGSDWKIVRNDTNLSKDEQRHNYSYWYFENELKDQYFEFLKNLQQSLQNGQENNKMASIASAAQLLSFAPEKEQMLLTMIVNKLGDPVAKIASKALHHLTEVSRKHPNMSGVIVAEAEKLLFRNNISEKAQHFALCFLASIAMSSSAEVCSKLVHICFSIFKILVQKGAVNNRTMQAILRCLQKAIVEAAPAKGTQEVLSKDMQDTIYRMVHLADIRVSIQTLGLLLQLVTVKTQKSSDRFYNALYKKMLDLEVTNIGSKSAAQLLHILHRAIHIDSNVPRAKAFVKRLLQIALYMPSNVAAGCLIVLHKLLRSRRELMSSHDIVAKAEDAALTVQTKGTLSEKADKSADLSRFDSDGEEKYEDIASDAEGGATNRDTNDLEDSKREEKAIETNKSKVTNTKQNSATATRYDPFHRVPAFAGAQHTTLTELLLLCEHVHPTVKVFAEDILNDKRIQYYGDPLRDFGLPHFLERFAFKNPKKIDQEKVEGSSSSTSVHQKYVAFGSRGKSVKNLTQANCTEDEMFIFNYLEHKRRQAEAFKDKTSKKHADEEEEGEEASKLDDVNDDEFEEYLDGFFGKKAKAAAEREREEDLENEDLDFLKEIGGEIQQNKSSKKGKGKAKAAKDMEDSDDGVDDDWGDDDDIPEDEDDDFDDVDADADDDIEFSREAANESDDEDGSIELNDEDEDDDDENAFSDGDFGDSDSNESGANDLSDNSDEEGAEQLSGKSRKRRADPSHALSMNQKSFAKKLKHTGDMSSLFAAADDFAELLEETSKVKGQGTLNAVFNKDRASDKQMKWEEKRHSNAKNYKNKKSQRNTHNKAHKPHGKGADKKMFKKKSKH